LHAWDQRKPTDQHTDVCQYHHMKRTTVLISDEADQRLRRLARRESVTTSEIVRRALESYLEMGQAAAKRLPFESLGASGQGDTASRAEEILSAEWADAIARDR